MNHTADAVRRNGLDYGGPAVIEPRLLRPETLRRHLSVGLPFAKPNALRNVVIGQRRYRTTSSSDDAHISNTRDPAIAGDFTLRSASAAVQLFGRRNREAAHESSRPGVLESLSTQRAPLHGW